MPTLKIPKLSPKLVNRGTATLTGLLGAAAGVGLQQHNERTAKGVRSYFHPGERDYLWGLTALSTAGALLGGGGYYLFNHPQFPFRRLKPLGIGLSLGATFGSSLLAGKFARSLVSGKLPTNHPAPPPKRDPQPFAQASPSQHRPSPPG